MKKSIFSTIIIAVSAIGSFAQYPVIPEAMEKKADSLKNIEKRV
jgi:hypothetical protein